MTEIQFAGATRGPLTEEAVQRVGHWAGYLPAAAISSAFRAAS